MPSIFDELKFLNLFKFVSLANRHEHGTVFKAF